MQITRKAILRDVLVNVSPTTEDRSSPLHTVSSSPPASSQLQHLLLKRTIMMLSLLLLSVVVTTTFHWTHGAPLNLPTSLLSSTTALKKPSLSSLAQRRSRENSRFVRRHADHRRLIVVDDMLLPEEEFEKEFDSKPAASRTRRAVMNEYHRLWDEAIVPYKFDSSYDETMKSKVHEAIRHWEENTCLRFVPHVVRCATYRGDDYVLFTATRNTKECQSWVGRKGGEQVIQLDFDNETNLFCSAMHEIGHAIGFWHEHTRPDRDEYVKIIWDNIREGKKGNFYERKASEINSLNVSYDYDSIMHYGAHTLTKNGGKTMTAPGSLLHHEREKIEKRMGQRLGLSEGDIKQANLLYQCQERTKRKWSGSFVKSGDAIALRFDQSPPRGLGHTWLTCPQKCGEKTCGRSRSTCAGYAFDADDWIRCNTETFRIRAYGKRDGDTIRVGDTIALESLSDESEYIGCNSSNVKSKRCRLEKGNSSSLMTSSGNEDTEILAQLQQVHVDHRKFVIMAENKSVGTNIHDQDIVGLRSQRSVKSWFTCRRASAGCKIETCGRRVFWTQCTGVPFTMTRRLYS
ncbi:protein SpAN-like isoform X2 [Oscarella lobularis]